MIKIKDLSKHTRILESCMFIFFTQNYPTCPKEYRRKKTKVKNSLNFFTCDIEGDWGNGDERKRRLRQAGYDYYIVQKRVNELI